MTENTDKGVLSDVLPLDLFKPKSIPNLSEKEISQLAKDLATNLVFTSDHVRREEWDNILGMVFMPIALGVFYDLSEEARKDIGMVYEYLEKAGPSSINGYPIFFSLRIVNVKDSLLVWEKYENILKSLDAV